MINVENNLSSVEVFTSMKIIPEFSNCEKDLKKKEQNLKKKLP